jgi:hypothetical protein
LGFSTFCCGGIDDASAGDYDRAVKDIGGFFDRRKERETQMKRVMKYALVAWLLQDEIQTVVRKVREVIGGKTTKTDEWS